MPGHLHYSTLSTADLAARMNAADAEVPALVGRALPAISETIDAIVPRLQRGGRLLYVGAGTSGRLGILDASECPPTFNTDPDLVTGIIAGGERAIQHSVENAEDDPEAGAAAVSHVTSDDVVVGIAASGRTPYVRGALTRARELGSLTVALSCVSPAELSELADHAIEVPTGTEFVQGSTRLKAGTATKLVLNMLTTLTLVRLGKTFGDLMVDVRASNEKLRARATHLVVTICAEQGRPLTDATARALLEANEWHVSRAVLAQVTGATADAARDLLARHGGVLEAALSSTQER
ncbi:N-acetylmuramic acid 6-phosphate etherase [Micrococcales bacterium 31B]|nr:N-acetylmuramic acid 6-phosphate etherase [Micrococcales bacterium 31B]